MACDAVSRGVVSFFLMPLRQRQIRVTDHHPKVCPRASHAGQSRAHNARTVGWPMASSKSKCPRPAPSPLSRSLHSPAPASGERNYGWQLAGAGRRWPTQLGLCPRPRSPSQKVTPSLARPVLTCLFIGAALPRTSTLVCHPQLNHARCVCVPLRVVACEPRPSSCRPSPASLSWNQAEIRHLSFINPQPLTWSPIAGPPPIVRQSRWPPCLRAPSSPRATSVSTASRLRSRRSC